jgi:hypothetical protein
MGEARQANSIHLINESWNEISGKNQLKNVFFGMLTVFLVEKRRF